MENETNKFYLHLEATGLNPDEHEIVEIGIIDESGKTLFHSLIKPKKGIPPDAFCRKYGIDEKLLEMAPPFWKLTDALIPILNNSIICAYNAEFDKEFIEAEMLRCGISGFNIEWICVMETATDFFGRRTSLDRACSHFGVEAESHRALGDAERCRLFHWWLQRDDIKGVDNFYIQKKVAEHTGKDRIFREYDYSCTENLSDCNLDSISEWVRPDGSTFQTISHSY